MTDTQAKAANEAESGETGHDTDLGGATIPTALLDAQSTAEPTVALNGSSTSTADDTEDGLSAELSAPSSAELSTDLGAQAESSAAQSLGAQSFDAGSLAPAATSVARAALPDDGIGEANAGAVQASATPSPTARPTTARPGTARPGTARTNPAGPPAGLRTPTGAASMVTLRTAAAGAAAVARVSDVVRSARATVAGAATRGPRRARLHLKRIDPWSVMKFSFAVSLVLFVVGIVATSVLYLALDQMSVFNDVNRALAQLTGQAGSPDSAVRITAKGVIGTAVLLGAVNMVLFTALWTLGAFVYNVCADLVGGIEVTLAEKE